MAEESKKKWDLILLLDSRREVEYEMELSEEMNQREATEFVTKQLERDSWWFLESGVAVYTNAVEAFYLKGAAKVTQFNIN
ncbi:hypothetical protein [Salimicrobium flavidum]|uniref:Uncharacterized protein n=1 Tax=Salimicrobium flavidum TaxID=570947 RepID=A0A1N7IMV8_9BACI|nr:hypothetical protein [Salimicrobium flavidum]SIS38418.1 hypothetical protein SAMN05421687_101595 [Salimicrobium flavidum]